MKRLYFINRFYFPDLSATSQLLTDLAEYLAEKDLTGFMFTDGEQRVLGGLIFGAGVLIILVFIYRYFSIYLLIQKIMMFI